MTWRKSYSGKKQVKSLILIAIIGMMALANLNAAENRSITVDGVNFTLSPQTIEMTMVDGEGDKSFSTTIKSSVNPHFFGFSVFGYGEGLPTYAILGVSSGGARGDTLLNLSFTDSVLNTDGKNPKVFNGRLPIHIYHGSEMGGEGEDRFLFLEIKLTVIPKGWKAPQPVEIKIRRVVSVEWESIPGHVYRIESSTDLKNWEVVVEEATDFTESTFLQYAEGQMAFYRVFDLTP